MYDFSSNIQARYQLWQTLPNTKVDMTLSTSACLPSRPTNDRAQIEETMAIEARAKALGTTAQPWLKPKAA
jgi:hypothetical protein